MNKHFLCVLSKSYLTGLVLKLRSAFRIALLKEIFGSGDDNVSSNVEIFKAKIDFGCIGQSNGTRPTSINGYPATILMNRLCLCSSKRLTVSSSGHCSRISLIASNGWPSFSKSHFGWGRGPKSDFQGFGDVPTSLIGIRSSYVEIASFDLFFIFFFHLNFLHC